MPAKRRDMTAGIFHIYTHCVWSAAALYRDDEDRLEFLRHLARVTDETGWSCVAYCLMRTHNHLIVRVDDDVLPRAMHRLNLAYARHYNRRHDLRGRVQFAPYGSRRLHDEGELAVAFAYVANNPVRGGLCRSPATWPWSSYGGTVGATDLASFVDSREVVRVFERSGIDPRAALRAFVEAA